MGTKLCSNGHINEDTWATCPYCQHRPKIPPTAMVMAARTEDGAAKKPTPANVTKMLSIDDPLLGWVVALNGNHKGQSFELRMGRFMIGKTPGECQLVLSDQGISSKHAEIMLYPETGEWFVEDMRSVNGTFINDNSSRLESKASIVDNDVITLGKTRLIFKSLPQDSFAEG